MTNTPTPTGPTQASASAPLPSPAPTAEPRKVINPKVTAKVPKTYSADITGPKHLFPNPIKVFVHNSDRTFRESPHFENTPHYTMENEADQNARSELKLPRIHTDNSGNIHVVSSTGQHLPYPELKKVLEQHLLKGKFKDNPYIQNKKPLDAHQKSVNSVVERLNKMYGSDLRHDTKSHTELAEKLHRIGKTLAGQGKGYKEIKRAQGDAIHHDFIEGLFESHGLEHAKTLKVRARVPDPKTGAISEVEKEIPVDALKKLLVMGKLKGFTGDIGKIRSNIMTALKKNQPKPSMWQDFKEGSKQAVSELGSDVSSVLQAPAKILDKGTKAAVNATVSAGKAIGNVASSANKKFTDIVDAGIDADMQSRRGKPKKPKPKMEGPRPITVDKKREEQKALGKDPLAHFERFADHARKLIKEKKPHWDDLTTHQAILDLYRKKHHNRFKHFNQWAKQYSWNLAPTNLEASGPSIEKIKQNLAEIYRKKHKGKTIPPYFFGHNYHPLQLDI